MTFRYDSALGFSRSSSPDFAWVLARARDSAKPIVEFFAVRFGGLLDRANAEKLEILEHRATDSRQVGKTPVIVHRNSLGLHFLNSANPKMLPSRLRTQISRAPYGVVRRGTIT